MGRLIDADKELIQLKKMKVVDDADKQSIRFAILELDNAPTVEAIPKADYENRLKADMVAMLEDLDLQIDELAAYNRECAKIQRLIRDRINKLKEDGNE